MNPTAVPRGRHRLRSPKLNWQRQCRYYYLRCIRQRGSAKAIARGLAAGVFAGLFPLFGLQTIIGVALAALFKGNKLMAAAGTWVSNPLTYVPIYFFNFRVGQRLLSTLGITAELPDLEALQSILTLSGWQSFKELLALGGIVSSTLFLGCFIVGLGGSVVAYWGGLWLIRTLRHRKYRRRTYQRL